MMVSADLADMSSTLLLGSSSSSSSFGASVLGAKNDHDAVELLSELLPSLGDSALNFAHLAGL